MASPRARPTAAAACILVLSAALAGCLPEPDPNAWPAASASSERTDSPSPTPSPTPTTRAPQLPTDCEAILSPAVLAQLEGVPLNDPAVGIPTGVQPDGTLVCVWGLPGGGASSLQTTIAPVSRGPALDEMNALVATENFSCYTPSGGTRCEKTWFSEPDLLAQGRTLFWREDILIDTQFTTLAPAGYTDAIIAAVYG